MYMCWSSRDVAMAPSMDLVELWIWIGLYFGRDESFGGSEKMKIIMRNQVCLAKQLWMICVLFVKGTCSSLTWGLELR